VFRAELAVQYAAGGGRATERQIAPVGPQYLNLGQLWKYGEAEHPYLKARAAGLNPDATAAQKRAVIYQSLQATPIWWSPFGIAPASFSHFVTSTRTRSNRSDGSAIATRLSSSGAQGMATARLLHTSRPPDNNRTLHSKVPERCGTARWP
jgi:hypothetical protein